MFKKIFVGFIVVLALVAGGLAIAVALQPGDFRVERKATINASASEVFPHVNNFHKWEAWSPWGKLDPNAVNTFEGPIEGKGAIFKWAGNKDVGKGQMTIMESKPGELVRIKLEFSEPQQDASTTDFAFKGDGNQTVVTWSMYGKHTFASKAIFMAISMDQMIGEKFEEGLASLKKAAETSATK